MFNDPSALLRRVRTSQPPGYLEHDPCGAKQRRLGISVSPAFQPICVLANRGPCTGHPGALLPALSSVVLEDSALHLRGRCDDCKQRAPRSWSVGSASSGVRLRILSWKVCQLLSTRAYACVQCSFLSHRTFATLHFFKTLTW